MPSKKAEINVVLSLNAKADKFHWQRFTVEFKGAVCSYIAGETCCISRWNGERRLSNGPFNQPLRSVVVVLKNLLGLGGAIELLFCHITKELNILKIKEISRIPHSYGEVKP